MNRIPSYILAGAMYLYIAIVGPVIFVLMLPLLAVLHWCDPFDYPPHELF